MCEKMGQLGEIIELNLQARIETQRRRGRTIVELLKEKMDGSDLLSRKKSLKERLGFSGMGCCGATWRLRLGPTTMSPMNEDEETEVPENSLIESINVTQTSPENRPTPPCPGMNLAAALAAERQLRAVIESDDDETIVITTGAGPGSPARISLMRLIEETDGYVRDTKIDHDEASGCDWVCCVCMGRNKGAAFIPCGHTFCRVCSRELWVNRGTCPLCNRAISEILDIY